WASDSGAAGPGWERTGVTFAAYGDAAYFGPQIQPVCRFYGRPGLGPNSHFFTVDPLECLSVRDDRGWMLESSHAFKIAQAIMHVSFPQGVVTFDCGTSRLVWRLYNNRAAQNDSNHRYTASAETYA